MDSSQTKQTLTMIDIKDSDVLFGRGPFCYRNPGNIAFRNLIQSHVSSYARCAPRSLKRKLVEKLISKAQKIGCRFLVRDKNSSMWCEAHPYIVRSKVSHALRDARILEGDVSRDKISNLHAPWNDKKRKPKSNGKEGLDSFTNRKVFIEEGNDIPLIDHTKTFPFDIQESGVCQARQQPQDLKYCASETNTFLIMAIPENRLGWNPNNMMNSIPFLSQSFSDCHPLNNLGMIDFKVLGPSRTNYLLDLHKNGNNTLSENCALHASNIHHYPYTAGASDISCHFSKKYAIPEHTYSNTLETEVLKNVSSKATHIWCKGPSP